jgi:hypothetical protein
MHFTLLHRGIEFEVGKFFTDPLPPALDTHSDEGCRDADYITLPMNFLRDSSTAKLKWLAASRKSKITRHCKNQVVLQTVT